MAATPYEKDLYSKLSVVDRATVSRLMKNGREPGEALRSVSDQQDAIDRETPTTGESVASAAMGVESAIGPSPALHALAGGPLGPVVAAHAKLLRHAAGTDEAEEAAAEQDPAAYGIGQAGATAADMLIGGGGARKAGGPAIGGAVKRIPSALRGLADNVGPVAKKIVGAAEAYPITRKAAGVATMGATEVALAGARALAKREAPKTARPSWMADIADAEVAGPAQSSGLELAERAVPKKSPLVKLLDPIEDVAPKAAPKPRAPRKPKTRREEAVDKLDEAPPKPRDEMDVDNDFMKQLRAENPNPLPTSDAARRAFQSLPVVPPPGPMTQASLKAAVADGVKRGVGLKELAKELGVTQGDIGAMFKGAQLGF